MPGEHSERVRRIADAVLYEGYVLWPYRRSALKNQRRWTFGGVYPEAHSRFHPDDASVMQTQCLVEGGAEACLEVRVRFLHVVRRDVCVRRADGALEPVAELTVGGERHVSWDEATEREVAVPRSRLGDLEAPVRASIRFPADADCEELRDGDGDAPGALVHSWRALEGVVEMEAQRLGPQLHRLTVRIVNSSPFDDDDREQALRQTFCSTHTTLQVEDGAFVSQTDPPAALRDAAEACENSGTWPVLAGERGERDVVLSSPIILPDHPEIAPESPGDLFDSGEVDQLLVLSILSMTDEERREMRDSDPRTREILERTDNLSRDELMRLHGAIREQRPVPVRGAP